jgi:hypothetical protein
MLAVIRAPSGYLSLVESNRWRFVIEGFFSLYP